MPNRYLYHSCAVYGSLKSTSHSITHTWTTGLKLISCPSCWIHFASASHLLLHSNTWSSTLFFVTAGTIHLLRLIVRGYVMPGIIWTPLPLLQPVHSYNELTLTSNTTSGILMMALSHKTFKSTRIKLKKPSSMVCLYFAQKAFCS